MPRDHLALPENHILSPWHLGPWPQGRIPICDTKFQINHSFHGHHNTAYSFQDHHNTAQQITFKPYNHLNTSKHNTTTDWDKHYHITFDLSNCLCWLVLKIPCHLSIIIQFCMLQYHLKYHWSFICNMKRCLWWPHLNVLELKFSDEVFRFRYTPQFQMQCTLRPKFSGEVFRFRYTPCFKMKCSDELHTETQNEFIFSDEVFRWAVRYTPPQFQMKWTRCSVHGHQIWVNIFRWSVQIQIYPPGNCQWQQINYCPIYVFNESPFETVTELGQLFRWSVQLGQLVRWSAQIYPPFKTVSDRRWSHSWSMSAMRALSKWSWN